MSEKDDTVSHYIGGTNSKYLKSLTETFSDTMPRAHELIGGYIDQLDIYYKWNIDLLAMDVCTILHCPDEMMDDFFKLLSEKAKRLPNPELSEQQKALKLIECIDKLKKLNLLSDFADEPHLTNDHADKVKLEIYENLHLKQSME